MKAATKTLITPAITGAMHMPSVSPCLPLSRYGIAWQSFEADYSTAAAENRAACKD